MSPRDPGLQPARGAAPQRAGAASDLAGFRSRPLLAGTRLPNLSPATAPAPPAAVTETLIPYRHVPAMLAGPARLPMLELRDTAATTCTDRRGGDCEGRVCLCHWAPWFAGRGRPEDGPDEDYEPPRPGGPLADLPAADPWLPPRRAHRRPDPAPAPLGRDRENPS